jgi:hypothetical protein
VSKFFLNTTFDIRVFTYQELEIVAARTDHRLRQAFWASLLLTSMEDIRIRVIVD